MTAEVPKIIGHAVLGPPSNAAVASKIVGFVIFDSNTQVAPPAHVQKKVTVRGRVIGK